MRYDTLRSIAISCSLVCYAIVVSPGAASAQEPNSDEDNFLSTLVVIEDAIKHLTSEPGAGLTAENFATRNNAVKRWAGIYLFERSWEDVYGTAESWPTPTAASWWRPEVPIFPKGDKEFIIRNPHSGEVDVFGRVVVAGSGEVIQVSRKDGSIISGIKVSDADGVLVIRDGVAGKEIKISKDDVDEVKPFLRSANETKQPSAQLSDLVGKEGLDSWKNTLERFAERPPAWGTFSVSERNRILKYYGEAVDDLKAAVKWKHAFEVEARLLGLRQDLLRLPEGRAPDSGVVIQVATNWNALVSHLAVPPEPRKGPAPEGGGEPPILPPLSTDEVIAGARGSLANLRAKLSELGTGEEVGTELEPLIDQLFYLHQFRSSVEQNEADPLIADFQANRQKFVKLFGAFSSLGTDATEEQLEQSTSALDSHWQLMQEKVARAATLRNQVELCQSQRTRVLDLLYQAVANNRAPLVEACAVQLGKKLADTVSKWDASNKHKAFDWRQPIWTNLEETPSRANARDSLARNLSAALNEAQTPLVSEALLQGRGFTRAPDGGMVFTKPSVSLQHITNQYSQQVGTLPDAPVKLHAIAHRLKLVGNGSGEGKWHFQSGNKQTQSLILLAHEIEFSRGLTLELEDGCHVFLVVHRIIGDAVPTVLLKGNSSVSVFCSEVPQIPKNGFVLGTGTFSMLAGAANVSQQNPPHAAWEWLAGPIPVLKQRVSQFWLEIWQYYLDRFLKNNSIRSDRTRVVFIDLLGLPKTAFNGSDNVANIESEISDYRDRKFDVGSIEYVLDSESNRATPVFLNRDLLEKDGTVYLMPDQLQLLPDDSDKLGRWVVVGDDQRQLRLKVRGVSSLFAQQRGLEVIRAKFGQNVELIPIQQTPRYRVVFKGSEEVLVDGPGVATVPEGADVSMPKMDHPQLIRAWAKWSAGHTPNLTLSVQTRGGDAEFKEIKSGLYRLPLDFRSQTPPRIVAEKTNGGLEVRNETETDVRVEYAIQEKGFFVFHDLHGNALKPGASFVVESPSTTVGLSFSSIRDLRTVEPFDIFNMREGFDDIVTYSVDLTGLLGARFPNSGLQPGRGVMIDHSRSKIHFESRRKNDVDDEWSENDTFFSGTWAEFFARGEGRTDTARYSFLARRDEAVRVVLECVPHFGSTFVSADEKYSLAFSFDNAVERENLKATNRDWFQRQLKEEVSKKPRTTLTTFAGCIVASGSKPLRQDLVWTN